MKTSSKTNLLFEFIFYLTHNASVTLSKIKQLHKHFIITILLKHYNKIST